MPLIIDVNSNLSSNEKEDEGIGLSPEPMSMEDSIRMVEEAVDKYFHNHFFEAENSILNHPERWEHPYFYVGLSYIRTIMAVFTMEKEIVEEALLRSKETLDICNKKRKAAKISSWFFKQDYNEYTDEEAHTEVIYAEANIIFVINTFISDPNIYSLVKAVLKLRNCYNAYHLCGTLCREKTNWKTEYMRKNFESAYKVGFGFTNLIMSHLPTRVLRILSFAGFASDRDMALQYCREMTMTRETFRNKGMSFLFCFYSFYLEQFFGNGTADLKWVKEITDRELENFPESAFDQFYAGRSEQLQGNMQKAIELFLKSVKSQNEYPQVHNVCNWDLLWSYAMIRDWQKAADLALDLSEKCSWSRSTNMYQYACFKFMILEETGRTNDEAALEEIRKTLRQVPEYKRKFVGRTIPPEKFAITKANEFLSGKSEMILPALELFYIWNIYGSAAQKPELLDPFLSMIETKMEILRETSEAYYVMLLLKGVCLRNQHRNEAAIECFEEILTMEPEIKQFTYIPPHAAFELGITYMNVRNYSSAKHWLEKARDHYTGFLVESLVHLRIHGALTKLREYTLGMRRASVVPAPYQGKAYCLQSSMSCDSSYL